MTDVVDDPQTDGTIVIPCPECGTPSPVHTDQRLATDFCPTCDYPLFWARTSVHSVSCPRISSTISSFRTTARSLWTSPSLSGRRASATISSGYVGG